MLGLCLLSLGKERQLLHLYEGQLALAGKGTELSQHYLEVPMCVEGE